MRAEKQLLKQEIKDKMDHYGSFLIMNYSRLSANTANKFRREIGQRGGDVELLPKRRLEKAIEGSGLKLELSDLPGHIGLVFLGNDVLAGTKAVFKFAQENNKVIDVLGLLYEGQLYLGPDAKAISELPSKDEMRAILLSTLEAPMAQTLAVMEAVLASVVYCLDNKSNQAAE